MTTPRTGSFASWDNTFFFTLGNDALGARPWLGTLYRVAIYDEVLSSLALEDLFIGAPPDATGSGDSGIGYESQWIENP